MDFQQFYLSAQGRVNRKQWWLYLVLPVVVVGIILNIIDASMGTSEFQSGDGSVEFQVGLLGGIWSLIVLIPEILVSIKRFHDRDKSGWWVLIGLVPVIGWIWLLIELGFLKGTEGPNRFGPPVTD